jgi:adhesin/invasin
VATLINGSGSCVLTPTTSGGKTLTATYGGDANYLGSGSGGVTHQVDAFGSVDPATSTASVPDGVAGNVTTVVIVTRDQFGNPVGVGGAGVTVDISGANSGTAVVTDNGDGTYTAEYTPAVSGSDTITIQINAVPIQGSPYVSTVS